MSILCQEYRAVRIGELRSVVIEGPSGIGKSYLVARFLDDLVPTVDGGRADRARILAGRCYEQETMPYKALDGAIDTLVRYLLTIAEPERQALLPDDAQFLASLFPVLRQIPECRPGDVAAGSGPVEVRTRAVSALRLLMERMTEISPVILHLEDLQWADRGSLELLSGLMAEPAPDGLMILATVRSEHAGDERSATAGPVDLMPARFERRITLGPLSEMEQRELMTRLASGSPLLDRVGEHLWRESGGHPMLLVEMARYARAIPAQPVSLGSLVLEAVIGRRVSQLPENARCLLQVIAVAGEPTPLAVLGRAIELSDNARERAAAVLRIEQLIRLVRAGEDPWLHTYHDKVQTAVLERLDPAWRRVMHGALARALEDYGQTAPATLARHWRAAGEPRKAGIYLVAAARSAADTLAVDHATRLFREALQLLPRVPIPPVATISPLRDSAAEQLDSGSRTRLDDDWNVARARCHAMIGLAESLRV
ncbi:MAG: AAA family ATPase, partial [Myxococcota bacterium]